MANRKPRKPRASPKKSTSKPTAAGKSAKSKPTCTAKSAKTPQPTGKKYDPRRVKFSPEEDKQRQQQQKDIIKARRRVLPPTAGPERQSDVPPPFTSAFGLRTIEPLADLETEGVTMPYQPRTAARLRKEKMYEALKLMDNPHANLCPISTTLWALSTMSRYCDVLRPGELMQDVLTRQYANRHYADVFIDDKAILDGRGGNLHTVFDHVCHHWSAGTMALEATTTYTCKGCQTESKTTNHRLINLSRELSHLSFSESAATHCKRCGKDTDKDVSYETNSVLAVHMYKRPPVRGNQMPDRFQVRGIGRCWVFGCILGNIRGDDGGHYRSYMLKFTEGNARLMEGLDDLRPGTNELSQWAPSSGDLRSSEPTQLPLCGANAAEGWKFEMIFMVPDPEIEIMRTIGLGASTYSPQPVVARSDRAQQAKDTAAAVRAAKIEVENNGDVEGKLAEACKGATRGRPREPGSIRSAVRAKREREAHEEEEEEEKEGDNDKRDEDKPVHEANDASAKAKAAKERQIEKLHVRWEEAKRKVAKVAADLRAAQRELKQICEEAKEKKHVQHSPEMKDVDHQLLQCCLASVERFSQRHRIPFDRWESIFVLTRKRAPLHHLQPHFAGCFDDDKEVRRAAREKMGSRLRKQRTRDKLKNDHSATLQEEDDEWLKKFKELALPILTNLSNNFILFSVHMALIALYTQLPQDVIAVKGAVIREHKLRVLMRDMGFRWTQQKLPAQPPSDFSEQVRKLQTCMFMVIKLFKVHPSRIINVDETALRTLPESQRRWVRNASSQDLLAHGIVPAAAAAASSSWFTAVFAVTALGALLPVQAIWNGTIGSKRTWAAEYFDEPMLTQSATPSHWALPKTQFEFFNHMDGLEFEPVPEGYDDWKIVLWDCAPQHGCAEFFTPFYDQDLKIILIYVPPGMTAFIQPLDVGVFMIVKTEYRKAQELLISTAALSLVQHTMFWNVANQKNFALTALVRTIRVLQRERGFGPTPNMSATNRHIREAWHKASLSFACHPHLDKPHVSMNELALQSKARWEDLEVYVNKYLCRRDIMEQFLYPIPPLVERCVDAVLPADVVSRPVDLFAAAAVVPEDDGDAASLEDPDDWDDVEESGRHIDPRDCAIDEPEPMIPFRRYAELAGTVLDTDEPLNPFEDA